jgi:hypothetical protein
MAQPMSRQTGAHDTSTRGEMIALKIDGQGYELTDELKDVAKHRHG